MIWKLIADIILIVHLIWVLAVLLGPIWGWWNRRWRKIHIWMMWIGLLMFVGFDYCPLTTLESWIRLHYDPSTPYPGRFLFVVFLEKLSNLPLNTTIILGFFFFWAIFWTFIYLLYKPLREQAPVPGVADR